MSVVVTLTKFGETYDGNLMREAEALKRKQDVFALYLVQFKRFTRSRNLIENRTLKASLRRHRVRVLILGSVPFYF